MTLLPDDRLFEGHFEGAPILPGVAHIALALSACAERGIHTGPLIGLRDIRFTRPLGPGDDVEIVLTPGELPESVRFEIRTGNQPATAGLLLFASHDDARE